MTDLMPARAEAQKYGKKALILDVAQQNLKLKTNISFIATEWLKRQKISLRKFQQWIPKKPMS